MELLQNVFNNLKHRVTAANPLPKLVAFFGLKLPLSRSLFPHVLDEKLWITLVVFVNHEFPEK